MIEVARDLGSAFVTIEPNTLGFREKLRAKLNAAMAGQDQNVVVGADTLKANRNLLALQTHLYEMTKRFNEIKIKLDDKQALAQLAVIDSVLRRVGNALIQPQLGLKGKNRLLGELIAVSAALDRLEQRSRAAEIPLTTMALTGRGLAGVWGVLTGRIQTFGGALTAVGLPKILASISGFHLLGETVLEAAAVLIPAGAAFVAFAAGAVGTVQDINRSMRALWVTTHALNQSIYPLTGSMLKLENAVKPAVYNLFGQALQVVNANTARFTSLATGAARVVQTLGARITVALTSGGISKLMKNATQDLATIGDIFGNIFGTIGNILKQMPGYAEILLGALDAVTKAIEALTGSRIGQWITGVFLAFHGFVVWAGLAATAAVYLGNGLVGLAAKFGLAEAGALSFNAAQFGTAIKLMFSYIGDAAGALVTFAGAEDVAAASSGVLESAFVALDAVNPLVWVGLAAAAIGGLVFWLLSAHSATQQYVDAAQKAFGQVPVSNLAVTLTREQADASAALAAREKDIAGAAKFLGTSSQNLQNMSKMLGGVTDAQSRALDGARAYYQTVDDQKALLHAISGDLANYSVVLKAAGGNVGLLNEAGITSDKIIGANKQQLAQLVVQARAAALAQQALALGTGRAAAAQNAQTNIFMQETVPAMKKVTDAEDALLQVITGGESAFIAFQQSIIGTTAKFKSPSGLADAAALAKGNLSGLNAQSLAFANTLYNVSIPALQKMYDALSAQGASTKDLTTVIATGAGEMLKYVGSNVTARTVIAALINNALGPGTVSLKNMNQWVAKNSTTAAGLSSIIARTTVNASKFAGVLQDQMNIALAQAAVQALGGQAALVKFAQGVLGGDRSAQQLAADGGAKVLKMFKQMYQNDLPKAKKAFVDWAMNGLGLSRTDAINLWKTLSGQLNPAVKDSGVKAKDAADKIDKSFLSALQKIGFQGPGITKDVQDFSNAVLSSGTNSDKTKSARAKLIQDLINAGVQANVARQLVKNLQAQINALKGKKVSITAQISAAGKVIAKESGGLTQSASSILTFGGFGAIGHAAGGPVSGSGGPRQDNIPVMASAGEWVIQATAVSNLKKAYGPRIMHRLNSFAAGGPVDPAALAAGGLIGSRLAAAQLRESDAYRALASWFASNLPHAQPGSYLARHRTTLVGELGTLGRRQAAESAAYGHLAGSGFTTAGLKHFASMAREEARTARDKTLSAADPLQARELEVLLQELAALAAPSRTPPSHKPPVPPGTSAAVRRLLGMALGSPVGEARAAGERLQAALHGGKLAEIAAARASLEHLWHILHLEHLAHLRHRRGMGAGGPVSFANGGLVGQTAGNQLISWSQHQDDAFTAQAELTWAKQAIAAYNRHVQQARSSTYTPLTGGPLSASAAVAQAFARRMLSAYGWGPSQWPPLQALWQRESGWNSYAVNPTSGAYGIPQCYSTDVLILTRRGWLKHNEVRAGDETIGYNPATGLSEWTKVTAVVHPGVHPVVRYGNSRVAFTTTPNHRWLMRDRRARAHMPREYMREIRDRKTDSILILAKPATTGPGLPISDREAALLGWIAGDGWERKAYARYGTSRGGGTGATFHILQTKQENWPVIEAALGGHGSVVRTRERTVSGEQRLDREWRLSVPYARDLVQRAGHPREDCVRLVTAMSDSQRRAWLDALFLAEGHLEAGNRAYSQNSGELAQAVKLALYLEGLRPSWYERHDERYGTVCESIRGVKPTLHTGFPGFFYEDAGEAEVWCVTTELGTWTAEQDGHIHLTGNSLGHGHPYNLGDYQNQIRWGLAYIFARYGSPSAAWAHEVAYNWYKAGGPVTADRGVTLRPGVNVVHNRTGRPEPLVPAAGEIHIHVHNAGVIGSRHELDSWLTDGINRIARQNRLTYAFRRSPSAR